MTNSLPCDKTGTCCRNVSAVQLDNAFDKRQSDSEPAAKSRNRAVSLLE